MSAPSPPEIRQGLAKLTDAAASDVTAVMDSLPDLSPQRARAVLAEALPVIGSRYGDAAAALAAAWYDLLRDDAGLRPIEALLAPAPGRERWDSLAGYAVAPLFGAEPELASAKSLVIGGLARSVANMHRGTVSRTALSDKDAIGWARHASANACAFCRMLATRGAVYMTREGASLGDRNYRKVRKLAEALGDRYHDHCHCLAVPSFATAPYEPPPYVAEWTDQYAATDSTNPKTVLSRWRQAEGIS